MSRYLRSLCWFRRDLRLHDHSALIQALEQSQEVIGVFVFDTTILDRLPSNDRRVAFIWDSLHELHQFFKQKGGAFYILHGLPTQLIPQLAVQLHAQAVFANRDYEPSAQQRDKEVTQTLQQDSIDFISLKDQVIFEAHEILTQNHTPFSVFTPYKKAWLKQLQHIHFEQYVAATPKWENLKLLDSHDAPFPDLAELNFAAAETNRMLMKAGEQEAMQAFQTFLSRIDRYDALRDFPSKKGVSYLSVHLRFGTLSIRQLVHAAYLQTMAGNQGAETWLSELIWREFYMAILTHFPHVEKQSFKSIYDKLVFSNDEALFNAWKAGQTGYPIVDAAMRQLNQTGYMHNRLRMITASFLVKDLHIDWRWGEKYFAEQLNDFDLAANNGGWQWCASTGCDAQPYFRIFNPITQSEKFDPEGHFIRKYIPEIAHLSNKTIHAPWQHKQSVSNYPSPIVDHARARQITLERYNAIKSTDAATSHSQ